MADFRVSVEQLKAKAEEIKALAEKVAQALESVQSSGNNLSGMWEGDAHDTFDSYLKMTIAKLETYKGALDQYYNALLQIAASYAKAEQQNTSMATVG